MERECNNCGSSEWHQILTKDYPERRRERDRTVQTVYACESCESEGRHFVHNNGGPDTFSGALR